MLSFSWRVKVKKIVVYAGISGFLWGALVSCAANIINLSPGLTLGALVVGAFLIGAGIGWANTR